MRKCLFPLVAALGLLAGCQSGSQQAPQIPVAPVYQAGSPVTLTVVIRSDDGKVTAAGGKFDADGDVGAQGEQGSDQAQDIKPDVTIPITPPADLPVPK